MNHAHCEFHVRDNRSSGTANGSQKADADRFCPDYARETVLITIIKANHSVVNCNQVTNASLVCLIIRFYHKIFYVTGRHGLVVSIFTAVNIYILRLHLCIHQMLLYKAAYKSNSLQPTIFVKHNTRFIRQLLKEAS